MRNSSLKDSINLLEMSDVTSLMFFVLYKLKNVPEFATLSELCYLLDGTNLLRLIAYFEGRTITIPTAKELSTLVNALLLYKYVNIDGLTFLTATNKLDKALTAKQKEDIVNLYVELIPIVSQYNIDRSNVNKYDR